MITISIDPIAFLNVRWYGIMVALAILVVVLWLLREARKGARISTDTVFTAAVVGIPSGVIFSRLLHVLDFWNYYSQHPGEIIGGSGLSIYGAILGAALGIWIYSRFGKFQFGYLADLLVPGLALAQAVGRVGCTINGCCYGTPTTLPWGLVYTHPNSLAPLGISTQPAVVYEIIFLLIVFGVMLPLRGKLTPNGSLFLIYLGLYAVWRFGIDFLRTGTPFLFGLHQAQVIALVSLAVIVPLLALKTRRAKRDLPKLEE
ncbi:MAG: prolipoprotein diacylglyceryl transferase [Chloroflexota bacterium]